MGAAGKGGRELQAQLPCDPSLCAPVCGCSFCLLKINPRFVLAPEGHKG